MYSVVVDEVQESAMMGGAGSVDRMEGTLFVAIQGGWCRPDGLECTTEGMVGVD